MRALLWVTVFWLTVAETVLVTWGSRADRLASRPGGLRRHSLWAAHWAALFEIVLYVGMILVVAEDRWLVIPGALGAWAGKYWAVERRRRKLNRARSRRSTAAGQPAAPDPS